VALNSFIISSLFLSVLSLSVYPQMIQNMGIQGGNVAVLVSDGSMLFAGLDNGGIYSSDNGGLSWSRKNNGLLNYDIRNMICKDNIILASTTSQCYRSSDQGENWSIVNGLPNSTIKAMGSKDPYIFVSTFDRVLATSDYGSSWIYRSAGILGNSVSSFITKDSLLIAGTSNGVFVTSDYGETWFERSSGLSIKNINDLTIIDEKIFAAIAGNYVYVSSDNGLNWIYSGNGLPVPNITGIFSNDSILYASPFGNGIYTSSDFGNNWVPFNNGYNSGSITNTLLLSDYSIFAGSESGVYEIKRDENLWVERNDGIYGMSIGAIEVNEGNLYIGTHGGRICRSSDLGISWNILKIAETFAQTRGIVFLNNIIYAINDGFAFRSDDGGTSWYTLWLPTYQLSSIAVKDNNVFIGSSSGTEGIWMSADGGDNWEQKNNGIAGKRIYSIAADDLNLYAGTNGGLYISSDSGENWIVANWGILSNFYSNTIKNVNGRIYTGGINDGVFLSTNQGASWKSKGLYNVIIKSIAGTDNSVYAATSNGLFRLTGSSSLWQDFNQGLLNTNLSKVEIVDTFLFVGTSGFGLWSSTLPVSGIPSEHNQIIDYGLEQNFPNPFNPVTDIKYHIAGYGLVSLKVYDALGREISVLVNEEKPKGSYVTSFNASGYSSGVYYLRLRSGSYSSVKKMILAK
jgi:photosystem II stability/assembly factor-like uncharacterized protein